MTDERSFSELSTRDLQKKLDSCKYKWETVVKDVRLWKNYCRGGRPYSLPTVRKDILTGKERYSCRGVQLNTPTKLNHCLPLKTRP